MCTYAHSGQQASYLACAMCQAPKHGSAELKKSESSRQGPGPPASRLVDTSRQSESLLDRDELQMPASPFAPEPAQVGSATTPP